MLVCDKIEVMLGCIVIGRAILANCDNWRDFGRSFHFKSMLVWVWLVGRGDIYVNVFISDVLIKWSCDENVVGCP
jgi:hypothetical protein